MNTLSRKQRQIKDRDQLILDVSRELFLSKGYHNVTMDMIANAVEYSKGTVYQHYHCKEAIISALCLNFSDFILKSFSYVHSLPDCQPYLKMYLLLEIENTLHDIAHDDMMLTKLLKSDTFVCKLDDEILSQLGCHVELILNKVITIVNEAVEVGELVLRGPATSRSIALGCWAMIEGTYEIMERHGHESNGLQLSQLKTLLEQNCTIFLKGAGWDAIPTDEEGTLHLQNHDAELMSQFKQYINEQLASYLQSKSRLNGELT